MIDIRRKEDCVGCGACVQRCPVQCILMSEDEQGFLYPKVDLELCINCGLCEKVCPVINQAKPRMPIHTYAAWNIDDGVRLKSSSGGIFFALAKKIIEDGGVVFGAKFNDRWDVIHGFAENIDCLTCYQGSKYVQSNIQNSFKETEIFLKKGRKVLFTGTPCQIAGLRLFLRKDYGEQLLLVETACHSVPSPKIWKEYLSSINYTSFNKILFRDKSHGWENYRFCLMRNEQIVYSESASDNIFMQGFLHDLYSRPSCFECPVKKGKSGSDILLADYWGIRKYHHELYDKRGVSLVMANSLKGNKALQTTDLTLVETNYNDAIKGNSAIVKSARRPKENKIFWEQHSNKGITCIPAIVHSMKPSIFLRIYNKIKYILIR